MSYSTPNLLPDSASEFEGGTTTWVGDSNTVLAVSSTEHAPGADGGTHAMTMTLTTAGTVNATSPRVSITAGAEYFVRAPIYLNSSATGRVFTLTVTWYNAPTGGSSLGTATGTVNLSSGTGWVIPNYGSIQATAPAGAKSATLAYKVTGIGAGSTNHVSADQIFFGLLPARAGNIMDYNTASMETDVSGWVSTSATIVPTIAFLADGAGHQCLLATATAAGDVALVTVNSFPVTAGTDYAAYAATESVGFATTFRVEIRWYDSGGALLATEAGTDDPWPSNALGRVGVTGTAPASAVGARVAVVSPVTAVGQLIAIDDVILRVSPDPVGNLLTYDEYSTEGSLPAWSVTGGTPSRTQVSSSAFDGYFALTLTPTTPGLVTAELDRLIPVTAETTYRVGAVLLWSSSDPDQSVTTAYRTYMDWYAADGSLLLADNPDQFYPATVPGDAYYTATSSETRTSPEGAAFAKITVQVDLSDPLIPLMFVDKITFNESAPEYTVKVDNTLGSVTLDVFYLPSHNPTTVTIRRYDDTGHASPMRGYGVSYDNVPYTPGPLVIEDYEAPLGTKVWYSVDWTGTDDGVTEVFLFTQLVDTPVLADPSYVWVKSPGIPALNLTAMMESPLAWARAARTTSYDIVGRRNPVNVNGVRAGRTGTLSLLIWDPDANTQFDQLLDGGLPLLIQAMPGYGLPGNLYISVGASQVDPLFPDARQPGWRWTLPITEIDRPVGGLQGSAGLTWQDVADNYATWLDVFDTHDTGTDLLLKG